MNTLKKLWLVMDNKKTITGIILLVITLTFKDISEEQTVEIINQSFNVLGAILTLIGLTHKAIKAYQK
jgi:hypothetical protein